MLITQLGDIKMFNTDARKLIQEKRSIQAEASILGRPFTDDTLFSTLQKCMIQHPVYKETVATVHQLSFDDLTTTLNTRQAALESVPSQKIDSRQANARVAKGGDYRESSKEADTNNSGENSGRGNKSQKICCYVCRQIGHGARQCNASVSIPKDSPLTESD